MSDPTVRTLVAVDGNVDGDLVERVINDARIAVAAARASAACSGRSAGSQSAVHAARRVSVSATDTCISISAQRCATARKAPIGPPNCRRSRAYAAA